MCDCVHYNSLRPPTDCSSRQRSHSGCQPRSTESQVIWAPAPREASADSTQLHQPSLSPHCGRTQSAARVVSLKCHVQIKPTEGLLCAADTVNQSSLWSARMHAQLLRHVALLALADLFLELHTSDAFKKKKEPQSYWWGCTWQAKIYCPAIMTMKAWKQCY